ncbi:MAG: nicotianamine synthase family protein [Pseudomonadota bacterium]
MAADYDDAREFVANIYKVLAKQDDLSPRNEVVTAALQAFIRNLLKWRNEAWAQALSRDPALHNEIKSLPVLCGRAEALMEKWWARRLLECELLKATDLESFWYYDNYVDLATAEWSLLRGVCTEHVTLIGSGALPLTAFLLCDRFRVQSVVCIDHDEEANEIARTLIKRLGYDRWIRIVTKTAVDAEFETGTLPICGSFVPFEDVLPALHAQSVRRCLVRDVEGLFQFCYRPKTLSQTAYVEDDCTGPVPNVINVSRRLVWAGRPQIG